METEKHYFKVGLFFLAVVGAFVYYLVTFGGDNENNNLKRYAIYFDHSVVGLERGAQVKLKGITVGLVDSIRFVSSDNDRILVVADISDTAPIRVDTVASVASQGITGASYLSLENTDAATTVAPLTIEKGEKYPVIPSRQSELQALLADAPAMMGRLTQAVGQAQKLLSDRNVAVAQGLLPEAHDALTEAAGAFREIKMLARTLREDPSIIIRGTKYDGYQVKK